MTNRRTGDYGGPDSQLFAATEVRTARAIAKVVKTGRRVIAVSVEMTGEAKSCSYSAYDRY